ncbi:hypothetical protein B0H15DRAFT_790145, partial [Mycena belliarum]
VYTHYQHSLNSLHDIIDRNDKESLAELHQYLNDPGAPADAQPPPSPSHTHAHARPSAKEKAERRRSLPARTSLASLASIAEFQLRRQRAAKLTQFFGVDYRDLIEDVLDSIEHGLNAERRRGTLGPDEAEVRFFHLFLFWVLMMPHFHRYLPTHPCSIGRLKLWCSKCCSTR